MKIFIETLGCPKNFNDSEFASAYSNVQDIKKQSALKMQTLYS